MNYQNRELKMMARDALRGKYPLAIGALLFYLGMTVLAGLLPTVLFSADAPYSGVLRWLCSAVTSLLLCVLSAGMNYLYLCIARNHSCRLTDIFYMFRRHPDRVILVGVLMLFINTVTMLPMSLAPQILADFPLYTPDYLGRFFGLALLSLALSLLAALPFSFVYYILADFSEMSAGCAIRESLHLAKHHFGRMLKLQLSFLLPALLSVFTMYLALLWVIPYMQTSMAFLYRDCTGELE